jgi:hypothetical protein
LQVRADLDPSVPVIRLGVDLDSTGDAKRLVDDRHISDMGLLINCSSVSSVAASPTIQNNTANDMRAGQQGAATTQLVPDATRSPHIVDTASLLLEFWRLGGKFGERDYPFTNSPNILYDSFCVKLGDVDLHSHQGQATQTQTMTVKPLASTPGLSHVDLGKSVPSAESAVRDMPHESAIAHLQLMQRDRDLCHQASSSNLWITNQHENRVGVSNVGSSIFSSVATNTICLQSKLGSTSPQARAVEMTAATESTEQAQRPPSLSLISPQSHVTRDFNTDHDQTTYAGPHHEPLPGRESFLSLLLSDTFSPLRFTDRKVGALFFADAVNYFGLIGAGEILSFQGAIATVTSLASTILAAYRSNPYHNWQHAVATMQRTMILLDRASASHAAHKSLDRLALLFAALAHDAEHRGFTNAFESSSLSDLALRYNVDSVLEHHHAAVLCSVLRGTYGRNSDRSSGRERAASSDVGEPQIVPAIPVGYGNALRLDRDMFSRLRTIAVNAILATDSE